MKKLLIVSTYGQDAVEDWFDLQTYFIEKHTKDFDFGVFLHDIKDEEPFYNCKIIGRTSGDLLYRLPEMFHQIYNYFRSNKYENYLLLDSDCFPIRDDWYENLLTLIGDRYYAAPVRTDNLDITPHPCALFIRGDHIDKHLFFFRRPSVGISKNLIGEEIQDIGTGFKTEYEDKPIFYPLIRSNFININPMVAAIYGDTFYHHGAGSRLPWFRSTSYWKKVLPKQYKESLHCYKWLMRSPDRFVSKLRGDGVNIKEMILEG